MKELSKDLLFSVIKKRPIISHKGNFGRAVIVGGNETYGGAVIMSAEAAVKTGTGLVTVCTSIKNHMALHARLPEAMTIDWLRLSENEEVIRSATVILIGPGLGVDKIGESLFKQVLALQQANQWLVIDGSAITLFAQKKYLLNYPEKVIFTPHQMEWQRLSGIPIDQQAAVLNKKYQETLNASIVLKSHSTEIYTNHAHYINPLGNPGMAIGGMGDTLAGMIVGFLAQFENKEQALCGAVYLHSLIGDDLFEKQYIVLPTQISAQIPIYMKKFI